MRHRPPHIVQATSPRVPNRPYAHSSLAPRHRASHHRCPQRRHRRRRGARAGRPPRRGPAERRIARHADRRHPRRRRQRLLPGTGGVVTGVTGTRRRRHRRRAGHRLRRRSTRRSAASSAAAAARCPTTSLGSLLGTLLANSSAAPGTPGFGGPRRGRPDRPLRRPDRPQRRRARRQRPALDRHGPLQAQAGRQDRPACGCAITTNEPGVVAVPSNVRPGATVKAKKGAKPSRSRKKLIKIPQIVLGYRQAGSSTSRSASRAPHSARWARSRTPRCPSARSPSTSARTRTPRQAQLKR